MAQINRIYKDTYWMTDAVKIYMGAAQDYSIEWDGSDAVHTISAGDFVFTGGNVGVGLVPISPLHIYEDNAKVGDSTSGFTIEQDGAGDANLALLLTGARRWRMYIDNSDSDKLKFAPSGNENQEVVTIDIAGNIGIGTATPAELLHISQDAPNNDGVFLKVQETGASGAIKGEAYVGAMKAADGTYSIPGIWFGTTAITPTFSNYSFMGVGGQSLFNSDTGKTTVWRINNVDQLIMDTNGDFQLVKDSQKLYFGAAQDIYIEYDGTDAKIVTDAVAASDLIVDCGTNKTVELAEPVYDDIYIPMAITKLGVTAPTWTAFHGNLRQFTFAINDYVQGSFELLHGYKEGTDLNIHVHIVTDGAEASKEVRYSFEYWIADTGEASTTATTITSLDKTLTNADGHHEYVDIGDITGTGFKIGAIVCFLLKRVALVGGDNPTNDPFVTSVGCHYQINTLGSRMEITK